MPEPSPLVVAIRMGYGHMRPAHALGEHLGVDVLEADAAPLAHDGERKLWSRLRGVYESVTRWSSLPLFGVPFRYVVSRATEIGHLHPYRDQSRTTWSVRRLARAIGKGLGEGLVEHLRSTGRPLLTTYFTPAHVADAAGIDDVFCVVTDSDIHRIWGPVDPGSSRINYLVPSLRARRRLRAYGVSKERLHVTGYPLPQELLGGDDLGTLKRNLAGRLARLDPRGVFRKAHAEELREALGAVPDADGTPLVSFAVGGAGAQTAIVAQALPGLAEPVRSGRLRLALVAGTRPGVAATFESMLRRHGLQDHVHVVHETDLGRHFRRFNALMADTDVLWTKPSELTFFGALGLALVLSPPVGVQESYNRRWARESGAALKQRDARHAAQWLKEWLDDGLLASAAWCGYRRLPKHGLYDVVRRVLGR